jgi:hypothetical protein
MFWLLACRAPVPPTTAEAPTAEEVMDRWVQARGPRVPHTSTSRVELQGRLGELQRRLASGSAEESLMVGPIELGWGVTPEQAWVRAPGLARALGGQASALAWEAELNGDWRDVLEVELVGADEGAWVLRRRWAWGVEDEAWIDQQTHLLRGRFQDSPSKGPPDTLTVVRYEEHLGMQIPAELVWGRAPLVVSETLVHVEAGATIQAPELALSPVELLREPGEELVVLVSGWDRPIPMLVDTGASTSLVPLRGGEGLELSIDTPGGTTLAELVAVPDLAGTDLGAAIGLELPYGLIGRDLLSRGVLVVDPRRAQLLPELPDTSGLRAVPVHLGRDGQPLVQLEIGEARITALLDTGAMTLVNRRAAVRADLTADEAQGAGSVTGLDGAAVPLYRMAAPTMSLAGQPLCGPERLSIAELPGLPGIVDEADGAALLGLDALPSVWALDLAGGTLWLGQCSGSQDLEHGDEAPGG